MKIIGDVHGKTQQYKEIVDSCKCSICVGDFGFEKEWDWLDGGIKNPMYSHFINMGNHDYIPYADSHYASLGNWNFFEGLSIFTVRGAFSIDRVYRTEGIDWFPNEELTYQEGLECFDRYLEIKPKIVISHDCPQFLRFRWFGIYEKSNTSNLLQAMWEVHKPQLWIFGHHHESRNQIIDGCQFRCLAELETFDI